MDGDDESPPTTDASAGRRFTAWLSHGARRAGESVARRALVLWYAARDPDTPAAAKAVLWGALAYLAEPIDAIPDLTPLLGYSDDMAVMGIAMAAVVASIKPEHGEKADARVRALFGGDPPEGGAAADPTESAAAPTEAAAEEATDPTPEGTA